MWVGVRVEVRVGVRFEVRVGVRLMGYHRDRVSRRLQHALQEIPKLTQHEVGRSVECRHLKRDERPVFREEQFRVVFLS